MTFKPGQSGNPNGRPPKSRALTSILEKSLDKTIEVDGAKTKVARKRFLAEQITRAVTEGEVQFADGRIIRVDDFSDWEAFVKWIYTHIDGSKTHAEITGEGGGALQLSWAKEDSDE